MPFLPEETGAQVKTGPSVLLIQPPFVQLNAPYPAPYYLASFLASRGVDCRVADHSIGLFR